MTRSYSVPDRGGLQAGDFNEDHIADAVFETDTGIQAALGSSKGVFTRFVSSTSSTQGDPGDLAVATFTSSGHLDVALGHVDPSTGLAFNLVDIMLGDGDGSFHVGQVVMLPEGAHASSITTADFNRDGKTDLAVLSGSQIFIFPGNGDGSFQPPKSIAIAANPTFATFKIRAGDFDADGRPDIALSDAVQASVLFNTGSLTFQEVTATSESAFITDFTATDVNLDGLTDLIVTLQGDCPPAGPCDGGYSVYLGQSGSRTLKLSFREGPEFNFFPPVSPVAADINGDGLNDIVGLVLPLHARIFVAYGRPDGSFSPPGDFFFPNAAGSLSALVAADLNRDGRPDLVSGGLNQLSTSLNALPRADCTASALSPSVTVCEPTDNTYSRSATAVHIVAHALDNSHGVTAMQVYADHQLKFSSHASNLDFFLVLPLGEHFLTIKAWNAAGNNFISPRDVTVFSGTPGAVCRAAVDTLHICAPNNGAMVASPVRVFAATNPSFLLDALQVYIDGKLAFKDNTANYVDRTFTLAPGTHRITVKSWDSQGQTLSQTKNIQVTN
jgi:hypothetical protein